MKKHFLLITAITLLLGGGIAHADTLKSQSSGGKERRYNVNTGGPVGASYQKKRFESVDEVKDHCGDSVNNSDSVCVAYDLASTYSLSLSNNNVTVGAGNVNFSFDPAKLNCVQGAHFDFSFDNGVNTTVKPSCTEILGVRFHRTFSHTWSTPDAQFSVPMGFVSLGVYAGASVTVGVTFEAGASVGAFKPDAEGIFLLGDKRPDYVYAQATPFMSGNVRAGIYIGVFEPFCQFGVEGNLNLISINAAGRLEAGIAYNRLYLEDAVGYRVNAYTEASINGNISAGSGSISAWKKFLGFKIININLYSWPAIASHSVELFRSRLDLGGIDVITAYGIGDDYDDNVGGGDNGGGDNGGGDNGGDDNGGDDNGGDDNGGDDNGGGDNGGENGNNTKPYIDLSLIPEYNPDDYYLIEGTVFNGQGYFCLTFCMGIEPNADSLDWLAFDDIQQWQEGVPVNEATVVWYQGKYYWSGESTNASPVGNSCTIAESNNGCSNIWIELETFLGFE